MKKIYLSLFLLVIICSSCGDFLKEESQDLVVPKNVKDFKELLYGEAYIGSDDKSNLYLDIMTDDADDYLRSYGFGGDMRARGFGYYAWQANPEMQLTGTLYSDGTWEKYYRSILVSNIVIDGIPALPDSETEKEDLMGEAYFIRAYSYFMLVNLYGQPYDEATAATAQGVPINMEHAIKDQYYSRESVANVYARINEDIIKATELLEKSNIKKSVFRIDALTADLLASRIFLYQKKYDKVISYSSKVIAAKPNLYDLRTATENSFTNSSNPEILFSFGCYASDNYYYNSLAQGMFLPSSNLMNIYATNDLRRNFFFKRSLLKTYPNKSDETYSAGMFGQSFRVAEAYLNRAEAYAATEDPDHAMDDVNLIRAYRIKVTTPLKATDATDALNKVKEERRRELCFENQRWFDLRRWGMPQLTHKYKDAVTKQYHTYILNEKDPSYTLPIPQEVRDFNPNLKTNDRPERKPVEN